MSCAPGPSVSNEDLDRWTLNVNTMLDSPRARRKFDEFLSQRHLDDAEMTLKFWEKCNSVLLQASHNHDLTSDQKGSKIHRMRFIKEVTALVEFAEEYINFDVAQLREFRQTVETNNVSKILKIILNAQSSASLLLRSEFELFRKNVIKELPPRAVKKKF